jgi:hypothetical protein
MQEEWHMAIICPIHKKGDECRMKNRGVSLALVSVIKF